MILHKSSEVEGVEYAAPDIAGPGTDGPHKIGPERLV